MNFWTTKPRGGGGKVLVVGPLKKKFFFAASLSKCGGIRDFSLNPEIMKNIDTFSKMKPGEKATEYFKKNLEGPAIKYNSKTYSLQALIPD